MNNSSHDNMEKKLGYTVHSFFNWFKSTTVLYLRITALLECVIGIDIHEFANKEQEIWY